MKNIASIDLGTNTFHILIVRFENDEMVEVFRDRVFVNLAEEGIAYIPKNVQSRLFKVLKHFRALLDKYKVSSYRATGTAALRTASNGSDIINKIKEEYNIDIEKISGEVEADLIYKGTRLAFEFDSETYLIMDIGGGSVEFIVVDNKAVLWSKSFPIGVSVLFNKFKGEDPFPTKMVEEIKSYLKTELKELLKVIRDKNIYYLIGASGSFDVMESIMTDKKQVNKCVLIYRGDEYKQIYQKIINSTNQERMEMKTIPPTRVKLMPIAMILIEFILEVIKPIGIMVSPYAMKEGMLSEMRKLGY